jgi:hypothetical protein
MAGIFDPGIFDSGIFDTPSGGTTYNRTCADSLSSLTEAVSRVATLAHTVSDTVATLTEATTRVATYARTVSDSLSSITEAVVAGLVFSRAVADSLSSLTEAVVKGITFHRTVSQTLGAISESVSRGAMSVTRTVADTVSSMVEYVLDLATPYVAGTAIYIDGVNVAKPDGDPVLFASAHFMSQVNGQAGTASFRVRDDLGTAAYKPGDPLELVIDGRRVWTGFVSSVKRVYAFPAINVDEFGLTRFFDIEGVDLSILFTRRIVFNQVTPEDILAPLYGPYTPDSTVISELVSNWLDLSGDAIDTSTLVENVGDINADQKARPWEGSDTWGQAMTSISLLPASIFYIDPTRHLVNTDTDTPNAPFGLSDVPDGVTSKGYREMEILEDGSNLANDVLCWGIGYGSSVPVFKRDEDATSQTDHGLWQLGQVTFGVYKQATIDRIADSILNGSPDHHRGAKDDRPAVILATYEPGLLPAQKVNFESAVFGWSDVIPIRKMEVTFEAPDHPRYNLILSHEIDTPWSFFDPWRFSLPRLSLNLPPFPNLYFPSAACCVLIDTYGTDQATGWGPSEIDSLIWHTTDPQHYSVSGGTAFFTGGRSFGNARLPFPQGSLVFPIEALITLTIPAGANGFVETVAFEGPTSIYALDIRRNGSALDIDFYASNDAGFDSQTVNGLVSGFAGVPINIRLHTDGASMETTVWFASDPEPAITSTVTPGLGDPTEFLTDLGYFFNFAGDPVNFQRLEMVEGFTCGTATGTATVKYGVKDNKKATYHPSDPQWVVQDVGYRLNITYFPIPNNYSVQLLNQAVTPGWTRSSDFEQREWIPVGGTFNTRAKIDFDSSMGTTGAGASPVRIGLFSFSQPGPWTSSFTIEANNPINGIRPFKIVDAGEWFDASTLIYASPHGVSDFSGSWTAEGEEWLGAQDNLGNVMDWIVTTESIASIVWVPDVCIGGGPLFGPYCEMAVRIDATHYQLSRQIVPDTSNVKVNGLLYILGTDYTETTPVDGILEFAAAVDIAANVYVCATANGPL